MCIAFNVIIGYMSHGMAFVKAFIYLYYLTVKGYILLLMTLLTDTNNGAYFSFACGPYPLHTWIYYKQYL